MHNIGDGSWSIYTYNEVRNQLLLAGKTGSLVVPVWAEDLASRFLLVPVKDWGCWMRPGVQSCRLLEDWEGSMCSGGRMWPPFWPRRLISFLRASAFSLCILTSCWSFWTSWSAILHWSWSCLPWMQNKQALAAMLTGIWAVYRKSLFLLANL